MKKINLLLLATLLAGTTMAQTNYHALEADETIYTKPGILNALDWFDKPSEYTTKTSQTMLDPTDLTKTVKLDTVVQVKKGNDKKVVAFNVTNCDSVCLFYKNSSSSDKRGIRALVTAEGGTSQTFDSEQAGTDPAYFGFALIGSESYKITIQGIQGEAGGDVNLGIIYLHKATPTTEPWLTLSATEVNLAVTPFAASDEETVTVKGGNLTAGTYTLTVPNVAGLTVEPASVTVAADGTVNQDIKLTYTSTVDVPEATAKVSVTINELPAELTITYSARTTAYTQTTVSDSTTWDWTKAGSGTMQLSSTTTPTKNDTILLANYDGITNDETFRSDALIVCGEYLVRDSKYFQGGYISFNAENKGFVTVKYSNTGGNAARSLVVNGTKDDAVSSAESKTEVTSSKMSVNAGKVVIMFAETADTTNASKYARVYSITYTVDKSGDISTAFDQTQVEAKAMKVIRDGQLLIIRDGKTYTAQGVQVQ